MSWGGADWPGTAAGASAVGRAPSRGGSDEPGEAQPGVSVITAPRRASGARHRVDLHPRAAPIVPWCPDAPQGEPVAERQRPGGGRSVGSAGGPGGGRGQEIGPVWLELDRIASWPFWSNGTAVRQVTIR
nr:hypothetical protein KPHV_33730 [Kitasatospora purpeofusca]